MDHLEEDDSDVVLVFPSDYPYQELLEVSNLLHQADVFVPGFIPPPVGLYNVDGYIHRAWIEKRETVLLPDRNIVSRLAQIAKGEPLAGTDIEQRRKAAAILAFSQCVDILIEPSVAFHELAPMQGNDAAHDELAWFRVADNGIPEEWIAVALGQSDQIQTVGSPKKTAPHDLAKPLNRWRRNYVVMMKIAMLELTPGYVPIERVLNLFQWMNSDFIMAGPAAIFACIYFATLNAPRKGLLKSLRSTDRAKALSGIKNAAWDVTHISEFVRRVNEEPEDNPKRFIFSSLDEGLRIIANLLIRNHDGNSPARSLALTLQQWWPEKDAMRIALALYGYIGKTRDPNWWTQYEGRDYVSDCIVEGEREILAWKQQQKSAD